MIRRGWAVAFSGILFAGNLLAADKAIKPGKYAKICTAGEGINVTILPLDKPAGHALVRIKGIEGDMDDKIIMHEVRKWDENADYVQKYKGKDYVTISMRSEGGGMNSYELYPPNVKDGILMGCGQNTDVEPTEGNPFYMMRDYETQESPSK